jgi:hypothetical protein
MSSRASRIPDLAAAAVLLFAFAATAWRDATQAITIDEATNFLKYARRPLSAMLSEYDANNHVLHTLLCRYSVHAFGSSEFAMRLPGLLGCAFFFVVIFRLSRDLFERAWLRPLAAAAIVLNPFTLDYLSAARGYGLGLSFFFWALFLLFRYVSGIDARPSLAARAAVALALSVASNLVYAIPAVSLGVVFTVIVLCSRKESGNEYPVPGFWFVVDRFWGPAIVFAFVILVLPLSGMARGDLYVGTRSPGEMYRSFLTQSLLSGTAAEVLTAVVLGIVLLVSFTQADRAGRFLALAAGTGAGAFLLLLIAHAAFGIPYPSGRTGIYFVPLAMIAATAAGARLLSLGAPGRVAGIACLALVALAVARFAGGFRTTYYAEWRFDAGSRRTAAVFGKILRRENCVKVAASWPLAPSLEFYAAKYKWNGLAVAKLGAQDAPYYLLLPDDAALIAKRKLKPLYTDPESGAIVASAR